MNKDNVDYLYSIVARVEYYYSIRKKAIRYIMDNQIKDAELGINLVLVSAVWGSYQINESLTEEDLLILFGLSRAAETEDLDMEENEVLKLNPLHAEFTLNEVFDQTVESFK
tara:strand:- start:746 stop:1081 length:336 start_codon:yes stop_codon:yes gene_type:complete